MALLIFISTVIVLWIVVQFLPRAKKSIHGKIAVVTGGGNGLGRGLCFELAKHGCNVIIVDVDIDAANRTVEELIKLGIQSKAYKVDVTNYGEIQNVKDLISKEFGEVDILINNAGIMSHSSILDEHESLIEKMFKVNLTGVSFMTKCFIEDMIKRQSGHIATVTSLAGLYHHPFGVNYCASKFGATGFMLALKEFIRIRKLDQKIFTTIIMPDVTDTGH